MISIRFARRALFELDRIEAWCQANQSALWPYFTDELAKAVRLLRVTPEMGAPYDYPGARDIRRVLLGTTQYYVYYRYHVERARIVILAIWSTRRGRTPALR